MGLDALKKRRAELEEEFKQISEQHAQAQQLAQNLVNRATEIKGAVAEIDKLISECDKEKVKAVK